MLTGVVNHLWQSTLFAAFIAMLCLVFRGEAARLRYGFWVLASLKFLVPFSLFTALIQPATRQIQIAIPEEWATTSITFAQPVSGIDSSWQQASIVVVVWLVGAAFVLMRWLVQAWRLHRLLRQAGRDKHILQLHGVALRVFHTRADVEPGIFGLLRPVLIWPEQLNHQLPQRELDAILAHEICHAKSRDNLTAAMHTVVEALFWFYPLTWWIGARLVDERERACDEFVLGLGHDRETYADGILNACELIGPLTLRCGASISGSDLKKRMRHIMTFSSARSLSIAKKSLLGASSIAVLSVPLFTSIANGNLAMLAGRQCGISPAFRASTGIVPTPHAILPGGHLYLPVLAIPPDYPEDALSQGIEGYVVLEYTIDETGSPRDIALVESSSGLFDQAALNSVARHRYYPRAANANPDAAPRIRSRAVFRLDDLTASGTPVDAGCNSL